MSRKSGSALSGIMLAMAVGIVLAANDIDGGQLNISGLVANNTCEARVGDGSKDGLILLQTATIAEATDGILDTTVGAKAKPFSATTDYSKVNPTSGTIAKMIFGFVFFGNSRRTLSNDISINTPSDDVDTALHNIEGSTTRQVQVSNPGDVYSKAPDLTFKSATHDFKVSYVCADVSKTATTGYVKTNSAYTITYQ